MTSFRPTRRQALAASFSSTLALLAPAGRVATGWASERPAKIRVGAPFGAVPGIKAAIEEKLFEREGIEAEIVTLSGGPNILAATVGGSLEIGYADVFAWVGARENGFDLAFLQAANGRGRSDYIIAGADRGIRAPTDLAGKTIGVAAHAQSRLRVRLYLERFGVDPRSVRYVIINQRETVGAALASGRIDAAIAADPNVAEWERQYHVQALEGRPWQQVPERASTAAFFAGGAWLSAHPQLAERFVRAARKGAATYNAYAPRRKAEIALKYDRIDLFALERQVPGILQRMNDVTAAQSGPVDLPALEKWLSIAQSKGVIAEAIDVTPLLYRTATAEKV